MLINLRNALMTGKRTPTAKDYVQSGLVYLYDGIENAGWGIHEPDPAEWQNLVGGLNAVKSGTPTWSDNAGVTSGNNTFLVTMPTSDTFLQAAKTGDLTVEICLTTTATWGNRGLFGIVDSVGTTATYRFLQIWMRTGGYYLPAPFNVSGTEFLGATPAYTNQSGTISAIFGADDSRIHATPARDGVVGTVGYLTLTVRQAWNPDTIDSLGIGNWYLRIGRVHNSSLTGSYHCVRLYSRALTADEIARNYNIDKARFNLP